MAQYNNENPITAPHSGAQTIADLNALIAAVLSNHSGLSAPAGAQRGVMWAKITGDDTFDIMVCTGTDAHVRIATVDNTSDDPVTIDNAVLAGLGSSAFLDHGTAADQIVKLDDQARLPAVDASLLNNVPPSGDNIRCALLPHPHFFGGYRNSLVGMSDGTLRTWGSNSNGQLGQGVHNNVVRNSPITPMLPRDHAKGAYPVKIITAFHSRFVLMSDGTVYSWGINTSGQLGHGDTAIYYLPKKIAALNGVNIVDISVGGNTLYLNNPHVMFLADDNRLFACGENTNGQLGLGDTTDRNVPTVLAKTNFTKVLAVGSNRGYTMGVDTNNDLYTWGYNSTGQLGVGDTNDRDLPTHVNSFGGADIVELAGGADDSAVSGAQWGAHSAIRTSVGNIYTWGNNTDGQLGTGDNTQYNVPQLITSLGTDNEEVHIIGGVNGATYVKKTDHRIFACGYNGYGQQGHGNTTSLNVFTDIPGIQRPGRTVDQILLSGGYSYHSLFVLYDDGLIRVAGYNAYGKLGVGDNTTRDVVTDMLIDPNIRPVAMSTLGYSSETGFMFLTEQGKCYVMGYGGNAQTANAGTSTIAIPMQVIF